MGSTGHGGRQPGDTWCCQTHRFDIDTVVQANEEFSIFIVDLSSGENGSNLFDQDSMASTEQLLHGRRENRIAI